MNKKTHANLVTNLFGISLFVFVIVFIFYVFQQYYYISESFDSMNLGVGVKVNDGGSSSSSTANDRNDMEFPGMTQESKATTWSQKTVQQFLMFQKIRNPNLIFDMKQIQQQATQQEADYLLTHGVWYWSEAIQQIYTDAIIRDSTRQINPLDVMNVDRTIYNENAIKQILAFNTPEGEFIINGVLVKGTGKGNVAESSGFGSFGINSGLISPSNDIIRCNGTRGMQRITDDGYDGIFGLHLKKYTDIDFHELPKIIPGFSFLRNPCNPCVALNNPPDYSCPFQVRPKVSSIWQKLWGITVDYSLEKRPKITNQLIFRVNH